MGAMCQKSPPQTEPEVLIGKELAEQTGKSSLSADMEAQFEQMLHGLEHPNQLVRVIYQYSILVRRNWLRSPHLYLTMQEIFPRFPSKRQTLLWTVRLILASGMMIGFKLLGIRSRT